MLSISPYVTSSETSTELHGDHNIIQATPNSLIAHQDDQRQFNYQNGFVTNILNNPDQMMATLNVATENYEIKIAQPTPKTSKDHQTLGLDPNNGGGDKMFLKPPQLASSLRRKSNKKSSSTTEEVDKNKSGSSNTSTNKESSFLTSSICCEPASDNVSEEEVQFTTNLDKFDSQIHKLFPGLAIYNRDYYRRKKKSNAPIARRKKGLNQRDSQKRPIPNFGGKNKVGNDEGIVGPENRSLDALKHSYIRLGQIPPEDKNGTADQKESPVKRVRKKTVLEKAKEELQDPEIIRELILGKRIGFYQFRGDIGSGNFSQVKLAIHSLTNEKVAIKILDKTKLDQKTRKLLSREVFIMELLHHPHIIRIYEVIDTLTKINIIMEYASGGELYTKINKEGRLAESYAKKLFSQILSAIEHVHDKGIVHRDIKAENIFLFTGDTVKLGDFGFSTTCHENQLLTTYCGSPLYAAPELFKDEGYVGKYVDIWALGVLLYYMVTGKMPFVAETMSRLKKVINAGAYELPPSPIGYHLIDYEDEDEMLAQMESPNTTISDHQERTPKKSPSMSEKINEQSNSPNSKKKISTFFKQLKRTMTEENILDRKISPTSMTDYKNRVKIVNPYAMNGKKLSDAEQAKHVANGIPGITQTGQYAAYFKNTGLTLTPECKYIIMGLLKTSPPNSRLSITKMRSSLWLKDQIFPKPLSPIRIIPPIQEEKGSLKRDPATKGTPRRVRNESVNKEFEEVKQELLALGITETHLKEALTRNTRNSIIGTYRILLHKVHKSKKPIKLLRNINTSFLHPVGPKIQNTNTRENETDDVSSTKNAKTISNINENFVVDVKESDKLLKESTKKLAILKENPIEANENNGGLVTNKMPIKSSPPTSRKNDVITNDTRAARLTKKSSKICAII